MILDKPDIKAWLMKASRSIYIAVEEAAADDISDGLLKALARIAELEAERDEIRKLGNLSNAMWQDAKARIAELEAKLRQSGQDLASVVNDKTRLEAALRPFAHLKKVEQARTAVIAEDDLITVVVRVGDIEAARAALSGEEAR